MSMCKLRAAFPRPCRLTVLGLFLAVAAGCGPSNTSSVQGKVVFKDGTPLTGGMVLFRPLDEKLQVSSRGDIQENGTFILSTYKENDGAVPGKYQVAITPPPRPKKREKAIGKPIIDPRFESYETSGLELEVKRGKNDFKIEVEKP